MAQRNATQKKKQPAAWVSWLPSENENENDVMKGEYGVTTIDHKQH